MISERPCYDNSRTAEPGKAVFMVCTCDEKFGDDPECAFHGDSPDYCSHCWRPFDENDS